MKSQFGPEVLADMLMMLGHFGKPDATGPTCQGEVALQNFAKSLLGLCGVWDHIDPVEYVNNLPEVRSEDA